MAAALPYLGFVVAVLSWNAIAGAIVARQGARRVVAIALGVIGLAWPLLAPGPPGFRFLIALGASLGLWRVVDLAVARKEWSLATRLALVLLIPDVRDAEPAPAALDREQLVRLLAFGVVAAAGFYGVVEAGALGDPARTAVRWGVGLCACYAAADAASASVMLMVRASGHRMKPIQRDPILARTVAEFWGVRWNRLVHDLLQRLAFRPVARKVGLTAGIGAAFFLSALHHAYLAGTADGWLSGALMGSFFLVHGLLVIVERPLRIGRRREAVARTWTIALFLISSPLFVESFLRVCGI